MRRKRLIRISTLLLLLFSFLVTAQASEELRIIKVRAAADQEFRKRPDWQNIIQKRMKTVSDLFEKNFDIRFELIDTVPWDSPRFVKGDKSEANVHMFRDIFINSVSLADAEIAVGFSGRDFGEELGVGSLYSTHAIISDFGNENGEKEREAVTTTVHEVCHLFGMFDVADENSVMNPTPGDNIKVDNYTLRYIRLIRRFDFSKGIDSLDSDIIKKTTAIFAEGHHHEQGTCPPLAVAHQFRGWDLENKGKIDEAIKDYREAIALGEEKETTINIDLGRALLKEKQIDEAVELLKRAISLDSKNDDAHHLFANAFTAQGKHEEALAERREAVRLKPDNATYRTALGRTLMALGKTDEAVSEFQTALKADPNDINPHYQLGLAFIRLKKYPEAVTEFREMARCAPQVPEPHLQAGIILLYYMHKPEDAVVEFRELVRLKPNDSMAHFHFGNTLYNINGKADEAIAEFREAVRLDPNNVAAKASLEGALKVHAP